jgi:hypothetical protein
MRVKSIYIIGFFCLIATIFFFKAVSHSQVDLHPNIEIPVMKNGYKVKRFLDYPKGTKSLNYYVKADYPADKVLRFYELKFKEMGWIVSIQKAKRQWECFVDDTIKGEPQVRQFVALWINPELKKEAFLVLKYVKVGDKWNNELHVICQIQPLIDRTRLESFMKQLDESGHLRKFMELINSYRMANGEVDIEKAIKENPDNDYLKEYKKIVSEMK